MSTLSRETVSRELVWLEDNAKIDVRMRDQSARSDRHAACLVRSSFYVADFESEGWLANRSSLTNAGERRLVDLTCASSNQILQWLRRIDGLCKGGVANLA